MRIVFLLLMMLMVLVVIYFVAQKPLEFMVVLLVRYQIGTGLLMLVMEPGNIYQMILKL